MSFLSGDYMKPDIASYFGIERIDHDNSFIPACRSSLQMLLRLLNKTSCDDLENDNAALNDFMSDVDYYASSIDEALTLIYELNDKLLEAENSLEMALSELESRMTDDEKEDLEGQVIMYRLRNTN